METTNTTAPALTITNAGTRPATPRKLFINLRVENVQRAITFFEALGFTFNRQFTDPSGTCMLIGEDAYVMLLDPAKFAGFAKRPVGDPRRDTQVMIALSADSREEVDRMIAAAVAAGGSIAEEPQDHGFMYGQSFFDLDGHGWEVFWMDPAMIQG